MSEKGTGKYSIIYNGTLNSDTLFNNVTGLVTGKAYAFYVVAINYNGVGTASDEAYSLVCLAPSRFA
jgi:hypothetical protein